MPTVHPCRHAAVLKGMSDTMTESGHQVESHFSLLIFLNFISSVIPYVEFDVVESLLFWLSDLIRLINIINQYHENV